MLSLLLTGCGNNEDQMKMEFAEATVKQSLEAWQQGKKPAELEAEEEPVRFFDDDWNLSNKLLDFEIRKTYMESDGTARCAVTLTVQDRQGKRNEVKCTYQIVSDPKVVVARDPMS
ncbi:hypothetical protein MFFC18_38850 [Mariniblastus fucicola]|uniref:Uncharacterized protein n=2 Tax=Mariniblastus fucicola TaxID=980251 RepID=A0A5B9PFL3_9BACT|nr:hypothetical protein MFFC18_38850 [Mariniblastus fucicola]